MQCHLHWEEIRYVCCYLTVTVATVYEISHKLNQEQLGPLYRYGYPDSLFGRAYCLILFHNVIWAYAD